MKKRDNEEVSKKSKRDFASVPEKKVKEIARKGGENSHGGGKMKASSYENSENKKKPGKSG